LYHFYIFYFNHILLFPLNLSAQIRLFYIYYLAYFRSLVLKILYSHYTYFHFLVKVGESLKIVLEIFVFAKCSVRFFQRFRYGFCWLNSFINFFTLFSMDKRRMGRNGQVLS
jgi:hypothetical protein